MSTTTNTSVPASDSDELYVGYLPQAPPRTARFVRRAVSAIVALATTLAAILAVLQGRSSPGVFEFGSPRQFEGVLIERPYPVVVEAGVVRGALLVREGKHGAAPDAAGLEGRQVQFEATRIESPQAKVLELVPGTLRTEGIATAAAKDAETLGRVELTGEIVDSKCFNGVMKPGQGKPHRSCAARCLSGGIPPQLLVQSSDGSQRLLLLAAADGGPLTPDSFLRLTGEAVIATGTVERRAGLLILRLDPGGLSARPSKRAG